MASKFVLTAQLQLQAPTNTAQIVNLVNKQLQGVQMNVNPVVNAKSLNQANQAIQKVGVSAKVASKSLNSAAGSAGSLGTALGAAARRFASITLATGFFLALTRAVGSAVGRAIDFEKEMLKISQVTGKSIRSLRDLSSEVTRLSTTLGVSSEELLNAARTLSQAGFAAEKVTGALKILAQTDLAATFDNIADTTEGAIAILSQFRSEVRAAGGEVQFLEKAMDSINSVSKSFAVESSDLISVVRRTGGVFEAAGGKLNELIALFTSVRATTRETADTIATGFRTIFTRIQRSETIDSLKELGIVLQDTEGKFVGPMEAIARLSSGLKALDPRDFRFNEIVEQLGGFRQIGKVIPLIKQYSTSTAALAIANNSMGSTAADAAIAQQGLGNQFAKLREQFDATIRSIASSDTFQTLATSAIKLAESILKIVESLEPLLPMLTALAAFKLGSIALPALGKFAGVGGRHEGGKIHAFAGGGMVPGKGNRDTVPAVLTPGEFVMRKSAVKKIGANNMADMNNGYAAGGTVTARRNNYGLLETVAAQGNDANTQSQRRMNKKTTGDADGEVDKFLFSAPATTAVAYTAGANAGPQAITGPLAMQAAGNLKEKLAINAAAIPGNVKNAIGMEDIIDLKFPYFASKASKPLQEVGTEKKIQTELEASVTKMSTDIANKLDFDIPPAIATDEQSAAAKALKKIDTKTISGYIFEAVVSTLTSVGTDAGAGFDYINTADAIPRFNKIFGPDIPANTQAIEAKRTKSSGSIRGKGNSLLAKIAASAMPGSPSNVQGKLGVTLNKVSGKERGGKIQGFAAGGKPTGTDTVPAMLTPGEYVVKKSAAQSIGYSNLHRMNQSNGVNGYAAGGIVGSTRNNYGVMPGGAGGSGGAGINMGPVNSSMMALAESATKVSLQLETLKVTFTSAVDDFLPLQSAIANAATGISAIDDAVRAPLSQGATVLAGALTETGQLFISLEARIWTELNAGATQFTTSLMNASKGMSTIDDVLKQSLVESATPLKKSIGVLDAEFKKFGKELKTKLVYFDVLKKANTDLLAVMEKLGVMLLEKGDDFNILKPALTSVEVSLVALSAIIMQQDQLFMPLRSAVWKLSQSMQGQATQISKGGGGGMTMMSGPMKMMASGMSSATKALLTIPGFTGQLNGAMVRMVEALNLAATNITKTGGASLGPSVELKKLEARIKELEIKIKALESAAGTAAGKLNQTKAPMAGGGGGGGMSNMANQAMMAAMMIGMMVTQMGDFSKATEQAINASVMLGSIFGMLALEVGAAISAKIGERIMSAAVTAVDIAKTKAGFTAAIADDIKSAASLKAAAITSGVAITMMGLAVAVAAVTFMYMKASAQAKEFAEEMNKSIMDMAAGTGGDGNTEGAIRAKVNQSLQKEAEARAGLTGAIVGAIAVVAVWAVVIASGGTALILFAAVLAVASAAGYQIGASMASVDEKLKSLTTALAVGAYNAAKSLNDARVSDSRIQSLGLEGKEKLQEQGVGTRAATTAVVLASAAGSRNSAQMASMTDDEKEIFMASDAYKESLQAQADMLNRGIQEGFKRAQDLRAGTAAMVKELVDGGMTMNEALADPTVKARLKDFSNAIYETTKAQALGSAATQAEAMKRLNISDDDVQAGLSNPQQQNLDRVKIQVAEETASKTRDESDARTLETMKADDTADKKAKAAAAQTLAVNMQLAEQANTAAKALNTFAIGMIAMGQSFSMVDMELASLTGSVKQYKNANSSLIGTLKSGKITNESAAAARETGSQFGLNNEVNALLGNMAENDRIRNVLLEKGQKELGGDLDETAANLQLEKFLTDNAIDLSGVSVEVKAEIKKMLRDGLQPDEVQKITDLLNGENEDQIKVLQELAQAQEKYLSSLFKFGSAVVKAQNEYADSLKFLTEVQLRGAARMAKAEGRELSVREVRAAGTRQRGAGMGAAGLIGAGVGGTVIQLKAVTKKLRDAEKNVNDMIKMGADDEDIIKLQNAQQNLMNQSNLLTANLKKLADQADLAAAIMGEIDKEKGKRDTIKGLISEFTFASNDGRRDMDRNFMALQRVMQTGNLNSIPDEMRSAVGGLLDTLTDIDLGGGMTGGDVKKQLEMQMANQLKIRATGKPLTAEEMDKIFNKTTKEKQLIDDLRKLGEEENAAAQALANQEAVEKQNLILALNRLVAEMREARLAAGAAAGPVVAGPMRGGLIQGFAEGGTASSPAASSAAGISSEGSLTKAATYRSSGENMFQPRGTDTVPAMLTPGEYVINRKAAKKNAGVLEEINNGSTAYASGGGDVRYLAKGGPTDGNTFNPQKVPTINTVSDKLDIFGTDMWKGYQKGAVDTDNQTIRKEQLKHDLGLDAAKEFGVDPKKISENWGYNFQGGLRRKGVKKDENIFKWLETIKNVGIGGEHLSGSGFDNLDAMKNVKDVATKEGDLINYWKGFESLVAMNHPGDAMDGWPIVAQKLINGPRGEFLALKPAMWDNFLNTDDENEFSDRLFELQHGRVKQGALIKRGYGRAAQAMTPDEAKLHKKDRDSGDSPWLELGSHESIADSSRNSSPWDLSQYWRGPIKKYFEQLRNGEGIAKSYFGDREGFSKYTGQWKKSSNDELGTIMYPNQMKFVNDFANFRDGDMWDLATGGTYVSRPMLKPDVLDYTLKGFKKDYSDTDGYTGLKNLQEVIGDYRKNRFSEYDHKLIGQLDTGAPGNVALRGFYKNFDTNKIDAQNSLAQVLASFAALPIPDGANRLGTDGWIMNTLKDVGMNSVGGKNGSRPDGGTFNAETIDQLGYVPWGKELYPEKMKYLPDNDATIAASRQEITRAHGLLTGLDVDSNPAKVSGAIDEAVTILRGDKGPSGSTLLTSVNAIAAANPVAAPAVVEAVQDINANEIMGNIDSTILKDDQKAALIQKIVDKRINWRMPKYAEGKKADGTNARSIKELAPTAKNFNEIFPYLTGFGEQVVNMIKRGAIVDADQDGISIDLEALSFGVKAKEIGIGDNAIRTLTVPDAQKASLEQLSSWSNNRPENWVEDKTPGGEERKLMNRIYGIGNIAHTKTATQLDSQIALTKVAMSNFDGYTGWDLIKKVGLGADNKNLNPQANDVAAQLKELQGGKADLIQERIDRNIRKPIARASGGPIDWSPQGTDTVPAMLTPGEFVMKKSAVDKYGTGFMRSINQGSHFSQGGEVSYFDDGGSVDPVGSTRRVSTRAKVWPQIRDWLASLGSSMGLGETRTTFERMHGVPADSVWSDDGSRGTEFDSNRVVGYNERSLNRIDAQLEKDRLEEEARAKRDKTFSDQKERFTERDQSSFIPNSEVTTGFTDSEWRMKVTAWREIEREARAENAKTDEEKRLKAAIMVAADKEAKEAEWWANKEAYDKKRQAEREAAPAKHAAWVREQKVNVATPGTSFYESMNEEEKTLNAAFQQEQNQEAQEREIRRRLEQRQGLLLKMEGGEKPIALTEEQKQEIEDKRLKKEEAIRLKNRPMEDINIGNWIAGQGGNKNDRSNAEDLMGTGLHHTIPFDIGNLIRAVAGTKNAKQTLEKMGFGNTLTSLKRAGDQFKQITAGSGYVGSNVRVGVPLSDDNIGGGLEKKMFETAFGPEMVDKFYPSFDKIFDYASKRNVKLNTKSRRMDSDPPQPSEKFLAESAQVFRYISSQLVADRLLNANMKSAGKDQGLITYKGDPTGVGFDRFAKNAFSNTWPTYWIQDKRLRSKAESLDSSQYLLNSREKMDYRSSQDDAVSIALNNGRQKLLSIIDNDEDNGVARFASGGSVFTPRGTDTVPAMLTPGEFVMKKSAVDKYGVGFMSSINEGRGSSRGGYMHEGGVASGSVSQFGDVATATKADPAISKIERTGTATLNKMTGMDKSLQSSTATIQETTSKTKADTSNIIASLFDLNDSITKEIKDGSISGGSISDEQLDLLGAQMDEFVQALLPVRQAIENIAGQMPAHVQMLKDFTADWVNLGMENRLDVINAKQGAAFVSHLTIMNKSKGNFGKLAGAFPGINLGGAAPAFMATGGMARGTDTVPAMLTPGEFVMKKSAVDKYGVGFMRGVNNGVQGFAKGGPVQYLQKGSKNRVASQSDALGGGGGDGGGFGEMVSLISSSLDAFNQAFTAFSGLSTMLGNIINSISNLNITHTINLQGALNIPGFSKEAIDNIVTTITDQTIVKTDEQIRNALSQLNIDNDNRADA